MPHYRLAHGLDEGNRFLNRGAAADAGDVVSLHPSHAAKLAEAGYLNLDEAGRPLVVTESGDKPAKKTAARKPKKTAASKPAETAEPDDAETDEPDDEPDDAETSDTADAQ